VEGLELNIIRHGRPAKAYLATLKETPSKSDYDALVRACVEAIVTGESDIIIKFSYIAKFPEGFPKGILVERAGPIDSHRVKARKLLTWLHEQKHTDITVAGLKQQREMFTKFENFLDSGQ
jgi:hypothetical protein